MIKYKVFRGYFPGIVVLITILAIITGGSSAFSGPGEENWQYHGNATINNSNAIPAYNDNFTFIQLSDVHIGYYPGIVPVENNKPSYMNYSVNNFTDTLQSIKKANPDFILITGDLVEYDKKDFFIAFRNILKSINIPVKGITPGNHDRRNAYAGLLGDNLSDYNKYIKPISNPASIDNNYSFDYKGYRFIGLDSGADYNYTYYLSYVKENVTPQIDIYDRTPESNGLSDSQLQRLKGEFNSSIPKIIFMHHPAMDSVNDSFPRWFWRPVPQDGGPGGNDGTIAFNRWNFINYTRDSNVQLVLTGHSHQDAIFNISGQKDTNVSLHRPLFIQTRSAIKDESIEHGYRIIEVKDGISTPYNSVPASRFNRITVEIRFPSFVWYGLHAYDYQGRHTGMNPDCSDIENGIPDSYYTGDYEGFTSTPQVMVSYSRIKKINVSNCLIHGADRESSRNISVDLTLIYQTEKSTQEVHLNNLNITSFASLDISRIINDYTAK